MMRKPSPQQYFNPRPHCRDDLYLSLHSPLSETYGKSQLVETFELLAGKCQDSQEHEMLKNDTFSRT